MKHFIIVLAGILLVTCRLAADSSVAMDGDYAVIGLQSEQNRSKIATGMALIKYRYVKNRVHGRWTREWRLLPTDGRANLKFGAAVSISDNRVVVGAPGDAVLGKDSGSIYVYELRGDDWVVTTKLAAGDGSSGDHFGQAVGVFGNSIVVGAPSAKSAVGASGAVYVFELVSGEWRQTAKLMPTRQQVGQLFGYSVAISANYVLVGVPYQNGNSNPALGKHIIDDYGTEFFDSDRLVQAGAAYVYSRSGKEWIEPIQLTSHTDGGGDRFGTSVSLHEEGSAIIVVGAPGGRSPGNATGAAYIFTARGNWLDMYQQLDSSQGMQKWLQQYSSWLQQYSSTVAARII